MVLGHCVPRPIQEVVSFAVVPRIFAQLNYGVHQSRRRLIVKRTLLYGEHGQLITVLVGVQTLR